MKLFELKCKNCGANLKCNSESDVVECPYCKASYKIDDEVKHVKYDDMENSGYEFEKGRIKAQREHMYNSNGAYENVKFEGISRTPLVVFAVILFITMVTFSIIAFSGKGFIGKKNLITNNSSVTNQRSFNGIFELYDGTVPKLYVNAILDATVTNNKKNKDKTITVFYNDIQTSDVNEIIELKKQFVDGKYYEVILDYGDNGLVNKITIK